MKENIKNILSKIETRVIFYEDSLVKELASFLKLFFVLSLPTFIISYVFLYFYVSRDFDHYSFSILPHLYVIYSIEILFFSIKILSFHRKKIIKYSVVIIHSVFALSLISYYISVISAIRFWGKVISKELILSYLTQLDSVINVFNINKITIFSCLFFALFFIFLINSALLNKLMAMNYFKCAQKKYAYIFLLLSIFMIPHSIFREYGVFEIDEPFHLTFFEGAEIQKSENDVEIKIDKKEDVERDHYFSSKQDVNGVNIILITGDSLRPDHMSLYGYSRKTTKNIENFLDKNEGVYFQNVWSICGQTDCGMQGLVSSKYVGSFSKNPIDIYEILHKFGYKTSLFLGGDFLNFYDSNKIFRRADVYFDGNEARRNGFYVNADDWIINKSLQIKKDSKPQFLQFHLMSTHFLGQVSNEYKVFLPEKKCSGINFDPKNIAECFNIYDNAVVQFDSYVGKILENLDKNDILKESIVIITADHGEYLGEHGMFAHAAAFYEPVSRIPFVLVLPENLRQKSKQVLENFKKCNTPISIVDIAPSILSLVNISEPPKTWEGVSITKECQLERKIKYQQRDYSAEIFFFFLNLFKLVKDVKNDNSFQFNLTLDPSENTKLPL